MEPDRGRLSEANQMQGDCMCVCVCEIETDETYDSMPTVLFQDTMQKCGSR